MINRISHQMVPNQPEEVLLELAVGHQQWQLDTSNCVEALLGT